MNKKIVFLVIGILAIVAAVVMKKMSNDSHLTELKDFWWVPLPLALVCFLVAAKNSPEANK
jgi:hypothetical protein